MKEDLMQFSAEVMTVSSSKNRSTFILIEIKKQLRTRFIQLFGFFVTTHSPYILTSVNNLLYADQVAKVAGEESVETIIPAPYWLDFDRLSVNLIGEGEISSILDQSICQVKADMIDSVSGILNEQYEQLLNLDSVEEVKEKYTDTAYIISEDSRPTVVLKDWPSYCKNITERYSNHLFRWKKH